MDAMNALLATLGLHDGDVLEFSLIAST